MRVDTCHLISVIRVTLLMPNGVVYSQGLRIRRIVSNEDKLQSRFDELTDAFIISGYNKGSVKRILDKVAAKPRVLSYNKNNRNDNDKIIVPWVITYGPGVEETRSFVQHGSKILNKSSTWKDIGARVMICTRRAPKPGDRLFKRKSISLSVPGEHKGTSSCGRSRCLSCQLINSATTITSTSDGRRYHINYSATCTSKCLVYLAEFVHSGKQYVGNTTQLLRGRITGRRNNKESALKLHLNLRKSKFNQSFKFLALGKTSNKLTELETIWINRLGTSEPEGLNRVDPCALRTGITQLYIVISMQTL